MFVVHALFAGVDGVTLSSCAEVALSVVKKSTAKIAVLRMMCDVLTIPPNHEMSCNHLKIYSAFFEKRYYTKVVFRRAKTS